MRQLPVTSSEHDAEKAAGGDEPYNPFAAVSSRGGGATWRIDGVHKAKYREAFVGLPGGELILFTVTFCANPANDLT